jgi:hypothetical protein
MGYVLRLLKLWMASILAVSYFPAVTQAQQYAQTNLVSNVAGQAPVQDVNLQNALGLVSNPTGSPWWVSNNADGTSTLYSIDATGAAHIVPINRSLNEFVHIPHPRKRPRPTDSRIRYLDPSHGRPPVRPFFLVHRRTLGQISRQSQDAVGNKAARGAVSQGTRNEPLRRATR